MSPLERLKIIYQGAHASIPYLDVCGPALWPVLSLGSRGPVVASSSLPSLTPPRLCPVAVQPSAQYKGILSALGKMWKEEGFKGAPRGVDLSAGGRR